MDVHPQVFRDTPAILVESIWWDARTDEVVWVDITAGTLHRGPIDGAVDGSDDRVTELPPPLSAVQPRAAGGYIAALGPLEPFLVGYDSDGLALDTDGRFWNGVNGGGRVLRWSPDGTVEDELSVPAPGVTSVAFGGPELTTLFVGTARENLTEADLVDAPLSGGIFRFDGLATGRPVNSYGRRSTSVPDPATDPATDRI
ncbi:SMP-30/gluconolactonase/LRE family protein [Plantibacter cousiniae (nom. nud.)]|uniref:SMP-30/gluconolactonase/LRE family protein n=1 Tax=Plantibacter cousiniae (nom. nud.) TaxID=199709 RepID=UPI001DCCB89F|nr:SMP-30/gluconolactonase/LRE family protein [Plantibacter cousiniae]CAH0195383.1 6-deoxy-6-sulfogluconolactonase [Plantibacter cousiniae]